MDMILNIYENIFQPIWKIRSMVLKRYYWMPLTLLSNALDAKYLKRDENPQRCVPVPSAHELVCKLHLSSLTVPHAVPAQQILGQHSEIALLKNRQFIFITILINQNFQQEYSQVLYSNIHCKSLNTKEYYVTMKGDLPTFDLLR